MKEIKPQLPFPELMHSITPEQRIAINFFARSYCASKKDQSPVGSPNWQRKVQLGMFCDNLMAQRFPEPELRGQAISNAQSLGEEYLSQDVNDPAQV